MDWLNYHHLMYFWMTARENSLTRAAAALRLSQPTLSSQIKRLEVALGCQLFEKAGRGLALTESGRVAFDYANQIFSLGRELAETVSRQRHLHVLRVGVVDALPKMVVHRLLQPALEGELTKLVCREGSLEKLAADLAIHELDVVLSDVPLPLHLHLRAFSHPVGECETTVVGQRSLVERYGGCFPDLTQAPLLLPSYKSALRRAVDMWLSQCNIHPTIVGEFDDSALLKVFGQQGCGLFFVPSVVSADICRQYQVERLGSVPEVRESYYVLSIDRRLKHPGVLAITQRARATLFAASKK